MADQQLWPGFSRLKEEHRNEERSIRNQERRRHVARAAQQLSAAAVDLGLHAVGDEMWTVVRPTPRLVQQNDSNDQEREGERASRQQGPSAHQGEADECERTGAGVEGALASRQS